MSRRFAAWSFAAPGRLLGGLRGGAELGRPIHHPSAGPTLGSFIAVAIVALAFGPLGCSPDFHETAGPTVPVPNLLGRVLRVGEPAADLRLKLEDDREAEFAQARTDAAGSYEFDEIPEGSWTLRIDSEEPEDFARITYGFLLEDSEAGLTLPDLDIGLGDFEVDKPNPGAEERLPGFFSPLSFEWEGFPGEKQVRIYRDSDGAPVWYSGATNADFVRWNGIGTEGEYQNQPAPPGEYRWRVRINGAGTVRYFTAYRALTLKE